ncbi:MAG: hypothetical protein D6718_05305 [Acidobacteria bacterium]|nr:MAG: hypothetical protein D6718_05305 [Acidobacteriota bacterium]
MSRRADRPTDAKGTEAAGAAGPHSTGGGAEAATPPPLRRPAAPAEVAARSATAVVRFHLVPEGTPAGGGGPGLTPAALLGARASRPPWETYPLFLDEDGTVRPFAALVRDGIEELAAQGGADLIAGEVARLARAAARIAERHGGIVPAASGLADAFTLFREEFDLSEAGSAALRRQVAALAQTLPAGGYLLAMDESAAPRLLAHGVRAVRRRRLADRLPELKRLADRLEAILRTDDELDPGRRSPESIGAELGGAAERFVDPSALAGTLPGRGPQRLSPAHRRRLETSLEVLRRRLAAAETEPDLVLFVEGEAPEIGLPGVEVHPAEDALAAAESRFDELASELTAAVRALRAARLEADGAFEEELHEPVLDALTWREATPEEQALVPRVVALLPARVLERERTERFVGLLRSARPVVILARTPAIPVAGGVPEPAGPVAGWLALSHRAAFALQGTLADPESLAAGFSRLAASPRTAVALCAVPSGGSAAAWWRLVAADEGRALPAFLYDPDAGRHWADRFSVAGNRQPEAPWPAYRLEPEDGDWEQRLTFAHAAALVPELRGHFRVLEPGEWAADQVEISELLDEPEAHPRAIPYLWIVGEDGAPARAVISRTLAEACAERLDTWHALQEMGGYANEHARRAAAAAREAALAEAEEERRRLLESHAEELDRVRRTATEEAVDRLVAVLTGAAAAETLTAAPAPQAPPPVPEPAAPEAAAEEPAPAEEPQEEEEDELALEPYIDSVLCTSCNECINLNPKLFTYNENKQAQIGDPAAGTFEQLVLAAEKCPARCIHPGAPRPGDATATDEMVKRAAKFN